MKGFKILFIVWIISFLSRPVFAAESNPFIPKIKEPILESNNNEYISPLKKWDVFQYDLIGVVLSDKTSLALIKTPDGEVYNLPPGSELGDKEDRITEILIDRLILSSNNGNKELILKNHEI